MHWAHGFRVSRCLEPGAIGAAMMAAVAVRRFADIPEACLAWAESNLAPAQMPDESLRPHYDRLFAAYLLAGGFRTASLGRPCSVATSEKSQRVNLVTKRKIAIIGDHFMLPEIFQRALAETNISQPTTVKSLQLGWPDIPMQTGDDLLNVNEYVGEPDAVARFIGDAEILINHLAPGHPRHAIETPRFKIHCNHARRPSEHGHESTDAMLGPRRQHTWAERFGGRRIHHWDDTHGNPSHSHRT